MSTYTDEPRAWVGCLACYNEGNLNGNWYSAADAPNVDIDELHDEETTHDELWVFDHENTTITGECDPLQFKPWGEAFGSMRDPSRWGAFLAWADDQHAGSTPPDVSAFESAYLGRYDEFSDYVHADAEERGLLNGIPEELRSYFNWRQWIDDARMDHTVLDAPGGGVYVFSSAY